LLQALLLNASFSRFPVSLVSPPLGIKRRN
jgi:hypothetical protein